MRRPRRCSRRPRGCSPSSSRAPATPRPCTPSGRAARRVVEEARERLAAALGARPERGRLDLAAAPRRTTSRSRGCSGRAGRRTRGVGGCSCPPSSTTRCWTRRSGWPSTPARSWCSCRSTRDGRARRSTRCASELEAHGDAGRADLRHVGEQRGRARCSRSPTWSRSRAGTACRCTPTRCRPSGRCRSTSRASGLDAMTVSGHKVGGPGGVGCAAGPARARPDARAARRRPGARGAVRARSTRRCSRRSRLAVDARRRGPRGRTPRGSGRCATPSSPACGRSCRTPCCAGRADTVAAAARATRTSRSRAARATRCSTCSTPPGSRRRPGRRARPGVPQPQPRAAGDGASTSTTRAARCGSASGTRRPPPTSTRCSRCCPGVVDRARAAGLGAPSGRRR